ncbi:phosphatase PAP2 family protein [Micromonospora lupini]|uniref:Membrane-associated Phosphoesterase PA-phosphatase n=1 Tax=Micromonospora lupini str. Lupac 08 TaxID=1150864 RepID=I0LDR5_9ACTN|nr:phosphatase PAP2 family protein [Micromonospora lupini]CCH21962.1 Membrane-associated Phosphoesterase PA-phosphatase [Micromonospora lupini str. Lupac 08]
MPDTLVQIVRRVLLPVSLLFGVMVLLGVLVTRVLARTWPFTVEDAVNREFAGDRTGGWNNVSLVFSTLASTQMIVVVTVLVALALRLWLKRWREPLFLCAAVTAQALVFLLTTMVIDRQRPAVEHMDVSPPTSSFPSGHTSAAVALYVGIAVLMALRARSTAAKVAWWTLLVMVPVGVALTRMYRGMHHPSDVAASFLNGGTCVAIMARAVLDRGLRWGRAKLPVAAPART